MTLKVFVIFGLVIMVGCSKAGQGNPKATPSRNPTVNDSPSPGPKANDNEIHSFSLSSANSNGPIKAHVSSDLQTIIVDTMIPRITARLEPRQLFVANWAFVLDAGESVLNGCRRQSKEVLKYPDIEMTEYSFVAGTFRIVGWDWPEDIKAELVSAAQRAGFSQANFVQPPAIENVSYTMGILAANLRNTISEAYYNGRIDRLIRGEQVNLNLAMACDLISGSGVIWIGDKAIVDLKWAQ